VTAGLPVEPRHIVRSLRRICDDDKIRLIKVRPKLQPLGVDDSPGEGSKPAVVDDARLPLRLNTQAGAGGRYRLLYAAR
jgi:hypothetical protein